MSTTTSPRSRCSSLIRSSPQTRCAASWNRLCCARGTEYGEREFSLEQKLAHVYRQLERAEAQIVFDPNTETIDIVVTRP